MTGAKADFAERRAEYHAAAADECEAHGDTADAIEEREAALWWRGLAHLPAEEGKNVELDAIVGATHRVDALLARGKVSKDALLDLSMLADQVFNGLNALAANGNKEAATYLLSCLFRSVDKFNMLAFHKPDVFKEAASRNAGIPGIISPHNEKTEANAKLVEKLEVGTKHTHFRLRSRKMPSRLTPAVLWAARLLDHIENARIIAKFLLRPQVVGDGAPPYPEWLLDAKLLPPFSQTKWTQWADVAWRIMLEATDGRPESRPELRPIGESAGNVKPRPGCARIGDEARENRIRARIEERITDAFRLLADGKEQD